MPPGAATPGPLRGSAPLSTCRFGGHELIWELNAADEQEALAQLPHYLAERSCAERIDRVPPRPPVIAPGPASDKDGVAALALRLATRRSAGAE